MQSRLGSQGAGDVVKKKLGDVAKVKPVQEPSQGQETELEKGSAKG